MDTTNEKEKEEFQKIFKRRTIDIKELDKVLKKGANHGVCGGRNLGNTCFMNSSIACLSNCTELTTFFLTGKYKSELNKNIKEGRSLAIQWNKLLEEYWNSNDRAGNPSAVKSTVARRIGKFGGFSQEDSNEFMTEFLSILNEDLNRGDKKKYEQLKEKGENETELECAKRFWDLHVKLNDSIVTDLFSGLFRSEVQCSNPECKYKNITFDAFNALILPIPSIRDIYTEINRIFYIPKYSIRKNCKLEIVAKKNSSLKDIVQTTENSNEFKYKLKKLKYIKVSDSKLISFEDENQIYHLNDFIFVFDDMTKEGEKNNIIPLYLYKNDKISSFPRLLFLEENLNYGDLKKKIFYYARNCFKNPFKEDKNEVDEELNNYKEKLEEYNEQKLRNLLDKEFDDIFKNEDKKEKLNEFLKDFPYKIVIKKKFEDNEGICIFEDGKDNLDNLKEFVISKDEDSITHLLDKINNNEYCLDLILNTNSSFVISNLNFDRFEKFKSNFRNEDKMNLDGLLKNFSSYEHLEKGNEWRCGKCGKEVEATKKLSIYYVPKLLIICLNRFRKEGRWYEKNGSFIDFPLENLDMGKYLSGPEKDHFKYDLFAVSQHYGGTGGGHYTAVCKNVDGKWYDYNDSSCSGTSSGSVVSSSAYVLFYRRQNW